MTKFPADINVPVPGNHIEVADHADGCHCPCGTRCTARPGDDDPPLYWMWWSTRNAGGFELVWRTTIGERVVVW